MNERAPRPLALAGGMAVDLAINTAVFAAAFLFYRMFFFAPWADLAVAAAASLTHLAFRRSGALWPAAVVFVASLTVNVATAFVLLAAVYGSGR